MPNPFSVSRYQSVFTQSPCILSSQTIRQSPARGYYFSPEARTRFMALEQQFSEARRYIYQNYQQHSYEFNKEFARVRSNYQQQIEKLRIDYNYPLILTQPEVLNHNNSFTANAFEILKHCIDIMECKVFSDFSTFEINNNYQRRYDEDGESIIFHPNMDCEDSVPPDDLRFALVDIRGDMSLEGKIVTLAHELSNHLIPDMQTAITGDPPAPEEAGHYYNLYPDSLYHHYMVKLENNWSKIELLAQSMGENIRWEDVHKEYKKDIYYLKKSFIEFLDIDKNHISYLANKYNGCINGNEICNEKIFDIDNLTPKERAGLAAWLFHERVAYSCQSESSLKEVETIPTAAEDLANAISWPAVFTGR